MAYWHARKQAEERFGVTRSLVLVSREGEPARYEYEAAGGGVRRTRAEFEDARGSGGFTGQEVHHSVSVEGAFWGHTVAEAAEADGPNLDLARGRAAWAASEADLRARAWAARRR